MFWPQAAVFDSKDARKMDLFEYIDWDCAVASYSVWFIQSTTNHVIRDSLLNQSASRKHNQEKSPQTFANLVNFSKNVSATFNNHTILLFLL